MDDGMKDNMDLFKPKDERETGAEGTPDLTGTVCSQCGAEQYRVDDYITCGNGHKNAEPAKLGATGNFPQGKLNKNDEGEIKLAVGHTPDFKKIIIDFGDKPIRWVAMDPSEAENIARGMLSHVKKCKRAMNTKGHGTKRNRG